MSTYATLAGDHTVERVPNADTAVPELETSVFLIPAAAVKSREERLAALNKVTRSEFDGQRGRRVELVFAYAGP